jgi:hypothetical protein
MKLVRRLAQLMARWRGLARRRLAARRRILGRIYMLKKTG